jgi:cytochrome c biogenesis protein
MASVNSTASAEPLTAGSDTTRRWLAAMASLKLTLAVLVALAISVSLAYERQGEGEATWPLVLPLALLAINLGAAILHNKTFRRQTALLIFHLALLAIVVLVALGRLTYLRGAAEVVTGGEFEGFVQVDAGPWHFGDIEAVRFRSEGFTIRYAPGLKREDTVNRVAWRDEAGMPRQSDVGDQVPLILKGYRFYTTRNKGFAPVFLWQPTQGEPQRGGVHLPAYPARDYEQSQWWQLAGMRQPLWVMLKFDEVLLDPASATEFRLPERHHLVVRAGDQRAELQPGHRLTLPDGVLVYEGLHTWMGYAVFYDWTIPWLLAACLVAIGSLGWHFHGKYFSRAWRAEG